MKVICKQNCSGKTKALIQESLDTDVPILVLDDRKRHSLEEKSIAYFQQLVKTVTLEEAKEHKGNILIDDIDKALPSIVRYALGNNDIDVGTVTLSA